MIPFDGGQILIDGKKVTSPGPDRAVVFQTFALLPWRTVLANVEFSLELRQVPKAERIATARDYLRNVGLADFENHYPHELSGGMQQRERKTVIFITHSMDEAVYLSDRVAVMTPRPGRVAEILEVPLPRPRSAGEVRRDPRFADLTNYIWHSLKKGMENGR